MGKSIEIGLFGFGCVGKGLHDVLNNSRGIQANIRKICVKDREKQRPLPSEYFTFDKQDLLQNPAYNLIVELIDNADDAYEIVTYALKNGKNVVTANKKMVAERMEELVALQQETGSSLLYEAAVCGSIPIIRTVEEYYVTELLNSVEGVFNGSCNYILSKMTNEGSSYQDALQQAQALGFAESDPTLDVKGYDARYKLVIAAAHSYGFFVSPQDVFTYGITQIRPLDIRYAKEKNQKIKLVAKVYRLGADTVTMYVMPQFIAPTRNLYLVEDEYNGVTIEGAFSDRQFFRGKGAGGHPTGSAVLSDIAANSYDYKYEYHKNGLNSGLKYSRDVILDVYFRYQNREQLIPERFVAIQEKYEGPEFNYVIAKVSLDQLFKSDYFRQEGTFLAEMPSR